MINKAVKKISEPIMPQPEENEAPAVDRAPSPAEIGEQLRNQRKARGISLIEIAEHTKIGKKYPPSALN